MSAMRGPSHPRFEKVWTLWRGRLTRWFGCHLHNARQWQYLLHTSAHFPRNPFCYESKPSLLDVCFFKLNFTSSTQNLGPIQTRRKQLIFNLAFWRKRDGTSDGERKKKSRCKRIEREEQRVEGAAACIGYIAPACQLCRRAKCTHWVDPLWTDAGTRVPSQVPQPTCYWQLGNLTKGSPAVPSWNPSLPPSQVHTPFHSSQELCTACCAPGRPAFCLFTFGCSSRMKPKRQRCLISWLPISDDLRLGAQTQPRQASAGALRWWVRRVCFCRGFNCKSLCCLDSLCSVSVDIFDNISWSTSQDTI